jgi:NDMA-dependent alcohol dehydrogenase
VKIQAAVFYGENIPFKVETLELAPPRTGEVLVKMAAAGVCHSDWHLITGATKYATPAVPGHEGAGIVEAVGDGVTQVRPGDHVILNWAPSCNTCFYCLNHQSNLCAAFVGPKWAGTMLDGTVRLSKKSEPVYHYSVTACFADYTVVPQQYCIPINKKVPLTVGALIGCAVTTGVGAALNKAQIRPGDTVAVFGAGGVGLNIIMGAKLAGAGCIIAVDRSEVKGNLAKTFGATEALLAGADTVEAIRSLTGGRGADYVFEAIDHPAVQEQCFEAVRPGGVLILVGIAPTGSVTNFPGAIIARQEKTVTGAYYGTANPVRDFPLYADLYLQGKLDLDRLISTTYPLEQINEAYADMLKGESARGIILFST